MIKLAFMIYVIAAPTLAGMALVAVLVTGADSGIRLCFRYWLVHLLPSLLPGWLPES